MSDNNNIGGSPPKPWERVSSIQTTITPPIPPPPLPSRVNLANTVSSLNRPGMYPSYNSRYPSYSMPYNRFGSYGGYGYSSPYNRFGSYASSGAYSRYGNPYSRVVGGPNGVMRPDEMSLTQKMEQQSQTAFMVLNNIVQAFTGFSQMLESTFLATQSSFMAMVGVAEHFGHLRNYLGQVLSIMALIRYIKDLGYRLMGKNPPSNSTEISAENFGKYEKASNVSTRPIWLFASLAIGLPWLISRLISSINARKLEAAGANVATDTIPNLVGEDGRQLTSAQIKQLEFCRALFDFNGELPSELTFKVGDFIAILNKSNPDKNMEGQWWRGRMLNGNIGMFPSNYVEIIDKKPSTAKIAPMPNNSNNDRESNIVLNPSASVNQRQQENDSPPIQSILNPADFSAE